MPLLLVVMVVLLALGVLVFKLGFATSLATTAQTAADAAALEGEKEVVAELQTVRVSNGTVQPPAINVAEVTAKADAYAQRNDAHLVGSAQIVPVGWGDDVIVSVETNGSLANGHDTADHAMATARASTDPLSGGNTPPPISNDASVGSGPRFVSHGGSDGFFPAPTANYSVGQEPEIAGRLDQLGRAKGLHLVGLSGFRSPGHSVEVGGSADDPHTCGAASDTPGVEGVSEATLEQFGLTRPFPGDPKEADHIQLAGTSGSVCVGGAAATGVAGLEIGNPNPHLVPPGGGPSGGSVSFGSLGPTAGWAIPWAVVKCESSGQNTGPHGSVGASGYYQISTDTWDGFGGYPAAYLAPKSVQDAKAKQILDTRGLEPWTASEPCWGPVIGFLA